MLDAEQLRGLQARAATVHVHPEVAGYLVRLAQATREHPGLERGASTRAVLSLTAASRARALWEGRDFVVPHDVADLFVAALAHRVVLRSAAQGLAGRDEAAALLEVDAGRGPGAAMSSWPARLRRAWRRLWVPPRRLRTTAVGRTYLVLTVGIGLAALNTGNNLLYLVLGLQLATIVVSGILSEQCVRRLRRPSGAARIAARPAPLPPRLGALPSGGPGLRPHRAGDAPRPGGCGG